LSGEAVIASEAKQSSAREARQTKEQRSLQMPHFTFCALRARWIASSP
jgi:hypothetical protein